LDEGKRLNVQGKAVGEERRFLKAVESKTAVEHVRPMVVGGGRSTHGFSGRK
jgi:hypothetical protein